MKSLTKLLRIYLAVIMVVCNFCLFMYCNQTQKSDRKGAMLVRIA